MTQVLMDAALGGDGQTYTNDGTAKNLDNGGHRTNFLPLMSAALGVAGFAQTKAAAAVAAAATAINAPGTQATSATSFTLATGSKVFTLAQAGKAFPLGATVSIARTSDPAKVCYGTITAFADPALTVNVTKADVAGGPFTDWTIALSGPAGESVGVGSVGATLTDNATLTAASAGYQPVAMTAHGKSVTEADATTLAVGGPIRILKNKGNYEFAYRNSAGALLAAVRPGGTLYAALEDNSTAAGVWSITGDKVSRLHVKHPNKTTGLTSSYTPRQFSLRLSSSLIVYFSHISTTAYATVYDTVNDTVIGPTSLGVTGTDIASALRVSDTVGVLMGNTGAVAFSVSGGTITPGTVQAWGGAFVTHSAGQDYRDIAQFDGTSKIIVAGRDATTQPMMVAMSITGTTITMGTPINVGSPAGSGTIYPLKLIQRSATQFLYLFNTDSSAATDVRHVTLSATTTLTYNSAATYTIGAVSGQQLACTTNALLMNTDEWWVITAGSGAVDPSVARITVSGTTVSSSAGTPIGTGSLTLATAGQMGNQLCFFKVSGTKAFAFLKGQGSIQYAYPVKITWAGSFTATALSANLILGSGVTAASQTGALPLFYYTSGTSTPEGATISLMLLDETFPNDLTPAKFRITLPVSMAAAIAAASTAAEFTSGDVLMLPFTTYSPSINPGSVVALFNKNHATPVAEVIEAPVLSTVGSQITSTNNLKVCGQIAAFLNADYNLTVLEVAA